MSLFTLLAFLLLNVLGWSNAREGCSTSVTRANVTVDGPVNIDVEPLTPIDNNRLSALNGTAHQEWYFDSFSADGTSDVTIVFFHQPGFPAGEIFVMFDVVWVNGSLFNYIFFVEESQVTTCPYQTTGIWSSTDQDTTFTFTLDSSLSQGTITATTPNIKGVWQINSTTPALYPSGELYPSQSGTPYFAPYNWWEEPIPSGTVATFFEIDGTPFSFHGFGGHETFWTAFAPWNYICNDWVWARFVAGPFTAVVWYYNSSIGNKLYVTALLIRDETVLFSGPSESSKFTISLLHEGGVSDGIINNATGFGFDFVQTSGQQKRWHFEAKHNKLGLQAISEFQNYTRFVDTVRGGRVGETVYQGSGQSEQTVITAIPLP